MEIPVLDLSRFLHGDEADRRRAARETDAICRDIGFLAVTGHEVPETAYNNIYDCSKAFFHLPVEAKSAVRQPTTDVIRGYIGMGLAALGTTQGEETPPDFKESFSIGPVDIDPSQLDGAGPEIRHHFAENLWPADMEEFRDAWISYYHEMTRLCGDMLKLFACALELDEHYFASFSDRHISILGAMFYPDQNPPPKPGQLRAGAHTDFGTLTILKPDQAPGGLEVLSKSGSWIPAKAPSDGFMVNIGDLMARWTNDRWVSTLHRVVNPPPDKRLGSERLSIGFFHLPNVDATVECLPSCHGAGARQKYPPVAAGAYLYSQFSSQVVHSEGTT